MTARDDAIEAALATGIPIHKGYIAEVIDAVPPRVLAQLAIDTGALERLGYISVKRREFTPDTDKGYRGPVYRIVHEDGGPGDS